MINIKAAYNLGGWNNICSCYHPTC